MSKNENALKQLKALRAQLRKYHDALKHYEKLFKADGIIDDEEQATLTRLTSTITKIEGRVTEKEKVLNFGGNVRNNVSATTESITDFVRRDDDEVDHSLVQRGPDTTTEDGTTTEEDTTKEDGTTTEEDTTTEDGTTEDTTTEDSTPVSDDDKYAAIAETPAVKEFLNGIHTSEGGYVDDPNDPGGKTKYGIAEKREWPAFAEMFGLDANNPSLIKDITKKQVDEYYIKTRFEQNGLDKINSAKIINAIFDQSILTPSLVKKNIKRALMALDSDLNFPLNNSEFSAEEVTAINASNADKLIEKFVEYQNEYYDSLVKKNPAKFTKYINGWKNRTARLAGFKSDTSEDGASDSAAGASSGTEDGASDDAADGTAVGKSDSGNTFEVPAGWGLGQIASEKGVTIDQLKEWNADKLKTYRNGSQGFNVGETIVVKGGSSSSASEVETLEVPKGWGLKKIARKHKITVEELKAWNADKLKTYSNGKQGFDVGETIIVKGGTASSSDTTGDEASDDGEEVTAGGHVKPSWLREAEKHIGKKETARMVKDDPWIKLLFEELGAYGWAKDQTVNAANWCAAFVSYCLKKTGQSPLTGFDGMRARTYGEKYGKEITRPVYGALVIVARGGAGHIGFVVDYNKNNGDLTILGGNQGKKVSIKKEKRQILAYRVPSSWQIPEQNYLD